ncbi:MAG: hypothetical protein GWN62_16785 [Aliifodinibius sp.]|nr:hypothetical protein [Fodinibius sp.]
MKKETKTHWRKLRNPDYLGAYSLEPGQDLTVKIEKVQVETVTGSDGKKEDCTVMHLYKEKPMILNATNSKMIAKVLESPYIEDWAGQYITLYAAKIRAFGEQMEALRVRPTKPKSKRKEELTPDHPRWDGAKKSIQAGNVTLDQIRKTFALSKANEKLLTASDETEKKEPELFETETK